jgi:hypothetical protein
MTKHIKTTPKGDRQRHRDAVRRQAPRKAMDGNHIRVRVKRRDEVDITTLSLALWLIARQRVEDRTANSDVEPAASDEERA